ncbi:MAG: hypothetical protein AAF909_13430 [Pseudomonadota bacterium]
MASELSATSRLFLGGGVVGGGLSVLNAVANFADAVEVAEFAGILDFSEVLSVVLVYWSLVPQALANGLQMLGAPTLSSSDALFVTFLIFVAMSIIAGMRQQPLGTRRIFNISLFGMGLAMLIAIFAYSELAQYEEAARAGTVETSEVMLPLYRAYQSTGLPDRIAELFEPGQGYGRALNSFVFYGLMALALVFALVTFGAVTGYRACASALSRRVWLILAFAVAVLVVDNIAETALATPTEEAQSP